MNPYTIKELKNILDAQIIGSETPTISKIYFDSRNIINTENSVFISLKGISYLEDAYTKGIRIYITNRVDIQHDNCSYLIVNNPLVSLQKWAQYHRNKYNLEIIGITGSNGKTIIKEWLNHLLMDDFSIIRSPKSYNSQLGLPLSVLEINKSHTLGIFEAGISQTNEMQKLEEILQAEIGVLTNIGKAHIENFNSRKELIQEKITLFKNSKIIIYNYEEEIYEEIINAKLNAKLFSFGSDINADIQLIKKNKHNNFTFITFMFNNKTFEYSIPFNDESSIENSLCLITILIAKNLDLNDYLKRFKTLETIEMRLEIKKGLNNCILINDTFNSDISSISNALNVLNQQQKNKVLVLSEIQHTNNNRAETFKELSSLVNTYTFSEIYLIGENIKEFQHLFKNITHSFTNTSKSLEHFTTQTFSNKAILIKGSRKYKLEKISKLLEEQKHDTILEVNLHAIIANINYFKSKLLPKTKIMAMVKAHSYGMGNIEIAEVLQYHHVDYLGVAYADEGALLRKKGIHLPILVMNPEQNSYDTIIDNQLEPEIYSCRVFKLFINALNNKSISQPYSIHLKIDTGMHRLGFSYKELNELKLLIKQYNNQIKIESIFSHLAVSDDTHQKVFTRAQVTDFEKSYIFITKDLNYNPKKHILNSSGIINYPEYQFDMVRLGIGMYGTITDKNTQKYLQNVAILKTVISEIIKVKKGETIGYGRRYTADNEQIIATLPIGYADGIPRIIEKSQAYVIINNFKARIIASICMDMIMCNVTNIKCEEGDEVIIFGLDPSINQFAKWCKTITYECFTSISPRVKRIYYRE